MSLHTYVADSSFFVILAPSNLEADHAIRQTPYTDLGKASDDPGQHHEKGRLMSYSSWKSRGWKRQGLFGCTRYSTDGRLISGKHSARSDKKEFTSGRRAAGFSCPKIQMWGLHQPPEMASIVRFMWPSWCSTDVFPNGSNRVLFLLRGDLQPSQVVGCGKPWGNTCSLATLVIWTSGSYQA